MKRIIPYIFRFLSLIRPQLAAQLALRLFLKPRAKPRPQVEMRFLDTGQLVNFDSGRKARTWGEGPVVWLLHGWESQGSTFYKLIPLLVDAGFQAVAWDAPAHGASPGERTHVPDYAESLLKDINQGVFSQPVAFVGHSFGGAALSILSKIYPLPGKVVIASAPTRVDKVFFNFTQMIGLNKTAEQQFIELAEKQSGYSLSDCSLINNDFSESRDVLVIHDREDDVIPFSDCEALQKSWKSGDFLVTENLGHRLTIKDDQILKKIIDFIRPIHTS